MSRKDFILIAETILNLDLRFVPDSDGIPTARRQGPSVQRTMIAEEFADMLGEQNDQFKRELFIQAATGVVPVNARKARV